MHIKKAKSRLQTSLFCLLALFCLCAICASFYQLFVWASDSQRTKAEITAIDAVSKPSERADDAFVETIKPKVAPSNLYWQYLTKRLIDVDFSALKKQNPDTAGWVQLLGTNINYPFVKTTDNDFYLFHSFSRARSTAGWVFADFRNRFDGYDKNIILYAHGRYDSTMFGTLRNILTSGWLNHPDNFLLRTATPTENALWQVFSVYHIPATNDYIQTEFARLDDFAAFAQKLKARSAHDFKTEVYGDDRILTLSTCFDDRGERVVLHAKLIKRSRR